MSTIFVAILTGVAWMGLSAEIGWGSFAVGAVPLFAMILLILGLGFAAGPVQEYSRAAADALLESSGYDEAVLSASGRLTPRGIR